MSKSRNGGQKSSSYILDMWKNIHEKLNPYMDYLEHTHPLRGKIAEDSRYGWHRVDYNFFTHAGRIGEVERILVECITPSLRVNPTDNKVEVSMEYTKPVAITKGGAEKVMGASLDIQVNLEWSTRDVRALKRFLKRFAEDTQESDGKVDHMTEFYVLD